MVTGGLAFHPILLAAARPIGGASGGERAVQCLVVHPRQHEHVAGALFAHDRRDQAIRGALETGRDGRIQVGLDYHASDSPPPRWAVSGEASDTATIRA